MSNEKVKHIDYGGGSQKKINSHNEVRTSMMSNMKVIKIVQKQAHFEGFWSPSYVTKIDVPHYVKFFCEPPP